MSDEAEVTVENPRETDAFVAVYDENKLSFIQKQDISLNETNKTIAFDDINAQFLSDRFTVK